MATYDNDLRLKEIATGDESGTWGTSTNTNLELIAEAFSYGVQEMAADANETFTMLDAAADDVRSFYLKVTSAVDLTATREITLGPNTVSKVWMIENATSGSQIITIKQGSGATVDVANGSKVMVVTDGAGAGAAVLNANPTEAGGTVTSVGGTGTVNGISLTGTVTSSGNLTLGGTLANVDLTSQITGTLPVANGGTGLTSLGTANQVLAVNSGGTALEYQSAAVGSVTSVDVSGGTTGLTTSGGPVTSSGTVTIAGTLGEENGGTGQTGYTTGDLLYASATDTLAKLGLGSAEQVLKVNSGGTQVEWADAGGGSEIVTVTRTSNTILAAANNSNFIDITSGTFTQTFTSAATLGNGWFCYIRNSGTGEILLEPSGAETIDGLTNFKMYPEEIRLIKSDGSNLTSVVLRSFYTTFTSSGTFTKPPGYTGFSGLLWGGGGSGKISYESGGGGGGACNVFEVNADFLSAFCTVTIGAGAAGVTSGSGSDGGDSSFDGNILAFGGAGGFSGTGGGGGGVISAGSGVSGGAPAFTTARSNGGFGGGSGLANSTTAGGDSYAGGGSGGSAGSGFTGAGGNGGKSVFGGGGGAGSRGGAGTGGTSVLGGAGGGFGSLDGEIPGGGGAATLSGTTGAGARGELRIWGVI